jgi:hypothetical protein
MICNLRALFPFRTDRNWGINATTRSATLSRKPRNRSLPVCPQDNQIDFKSQLAAAISSTVLPS